VAVVVVTVVEVEHWLTVTVTVAVIVIVAMEFVAVVVEVDLVVVVVVWEVVEVVTPDEPIWKAIKERAVTVAVNEPPEMAIGDCTAMLLLAFVR